MSNIANIGFTPQKVKCNFCKKHIDSRKARPYKHIIQYSNGKIVYWYICEECDKKRGNQCKTQ